MLTIEVLNKLSVEKYILDNYSSIILIDIFSNRFDIYIDYHGLKPTGISHKKHDYPIPPY